MKEAFKNYEKTIKKKHQFTWKPHYQEEFRTSLAAKEFVAIALLALEELEWTVVYYDDKAVEAKTFRKNWNQAHKITISFQHGKVLMHSSCSEDWFWDSGINSKRVKLFIHAFQETAKSTDAATLASFIQEIKADNNWEDYEVPKTLPPPPPRATPKPWVLVVGSLLLGIPLGLTLGALSHYWTYYIFAFEFVAGLLLGGAFVVLIKWSHYTALLPLHIALIATILLSFFVHNYFLYYLLTEVEGLPAIGFVPYLQIVLESGFVLEDNNFGTIGIVISWLVQVGLTYVFAQHFLSSGVTDYKAARVPPEVLLFTQYQLSKQKNEESVKLELAKMGWKKPQDQEDVFAAVTIIDEYQKLLRAA